jgi:hypothetical protein
MQAVESQNLILYQTDLRGQWPEAPARAFAARLPYARRIAARSTGERGRASLAGIALALRALGELLGRRVLAGELVFAAGVKPRLATPAARAVGEASLAPAGVGHAENGAAAMDFSISHSGPWVACAALTHGRVGLDIEMGTDAHIADWVVHEAALKASGAGLRALGEVRRLRLQEVRADWRGETWHVRRLQQFPGAAACVLSSVEVRTVEARALALAELFAS